MSGKPQDLVRPGRLRHPASVVAFDRLRISYGRIPGLSFRTRFHRPPAQDPTPTGEELPADDHPEEGPADAGDRREDAGSVRDGAATAGGTTDGRAKDGEQTDGAARAGRGAGGGRSRPV